MSTHQKTIEGIVKKLKAQKYGPALVSSFLKRQNDAWVNIATKIMPLYEHQICPPTTMLDYKTFALMKTTISIEQLVKIIESLPENGSFEIDLDGIKFSVHGQYIGDYYRFDSGTEFFDIQWSFERYHYSNQSSGVTNEPLVSPDLPFFPDYRSCMQDFIGIDVDRYSSPWGIVLCLPKYGARILEVKISSKTLNIQIEAKTEALNDIVGKYYCNVGKETEKGDLVFENNSNSCTINLKSKPDFFHIVLISKKTSELLDERRFGFGWHLPKGVSVTIPDYDLQELIKNGETETVELKESIGEPVEFAETVVAFANQQGGVIILGVNDKTVTVGLDSRNQRDTVTNIISSRCEPPVDYSMEDRILNEKKLLLVHIKEGKDKPYILREKGPYIRANGTDRTATRFELDQFYGKNARSSYL